MGPGGYPDLKSAVEALQAERTTSAELVNAALQRISAWNPRVGALTEVLAERARQDAKRVDRCRAAEAPLPDLAGVPVVVKDIIDTTPAACPAGLSFLETYRPKQDALVVKRLRRAGAVVVGVSATDSGAFGVRTAAVTHPQAPEHTVGGSSGGSGAALAAGFCFAALGTDTGGSIRIPSACCLTTGLMPSPKRVGTKGVRPLVWSLDHVGPMTCRAHDLAYVERVLDPGFKHTAAKTARGRLVVGHAPNYWRDADSAVREATVRALDASGEIGAEVKEVSLPDPDEVIEVHTLIFCAEAAAYHFQTFPDHLEEYPPVPRQLLDLAEEHRGYQYVQASRRRSEMTRRVQALFDAVDFLILPTLPVVAPLRGAETVSVGGVDRDFTLALIRYTCLFDHTGQPVVSLPASIIGPGLGASVQVVGPRNSDADVIAFAERLEEALDLEIDCGINVGNGDPRRGADA